MKTNNHLLSALLLVFCALFLSSCEKMFNKPPEVENQEFSVFENSPQGTEIGQIVVSDKSGQELSYRIIEGDDDEIFALNEKTGILSVNNSQFLDYESIESKTIKVEVEDEFGKMDDCDVKVTIKDVVPTADHLLSYYKFNGNSADETGLSNATVTNGTYVTDDGFAGNMVLSLSGSGYADLNKGFDYSSRTVSLWFKVSSISTNLEVIFANDYENYQYGFTSMGVQNVNGLDNYLFNISGNPVLTPISENKWYNAVAVLDNNVYYYYINGNLVSSGTNLSYVNSTLGYKNPVVGASRNFDRNIAGKIAEVRLYSKALNAEEVKTIFLETME